MMDPSWIHYGSIMDPWWIYDGPMMDMEKCRAEKCCWNHYLNGNFHNSLQEKEPQTKKISTILTFRGASFYEGPCFFWASSKEDLQSVLASGRNIYFPRRTCCPKGANYRKVGSRKKIWGNPITESCVLSLITCSTGWNLQKHVYLIYFVRKCAKSFVFCFFNIFFIFPIYPLVGYDA